MGLIQKCHPLVLAAAKVGFAARSFVYLLVSFLLIYAAFFSTSANGVTTTEAFQSLETVLAGRVLLVVIGAGLWTYALWRFDQAVFDTYNKGETPKAWLSRAGMAMSGFSYALVGSSAIAITFGDNASRGGGTTKSVSHWLLDQPLGRTTLALFGVSLIAIGFAQIWRTWNQQWRDSLNLEGLGKKFVGVVNFGIAGRGLLFILMGISLAYGAWVFDADQTVGMASALGWLRGQPFGLWLYLLSALAIGAYGTYSGLQAIYVREDKGRSEIG